MIPAKRGILITTKRNGDTFDIIAGIKAALPIAAKQLKNFAKHIKQPGDTAQTFAHKVAAFIQQNFVYVKDGYTEQRIKLPSALYAEKNGDCKSFSLFFAGAMTAAGYENNLKFVGYQKNGNFTHVFNTYEYQGQTLPIDTCIKPFNRETNHKINASMNVTMLGEPEEINGRRERRQERRQARQERRQERREERKASGSKPFRRVALAPGRGAFLLLVNLNVRNIAKRLAKAPSDKVSDFWKRLGGKPEKLNAAISNGAKKPRILGFDEISEQIGEPGTAAAAITAAAPVLLALVKFFKTIKSEEPEDAGLTKELTDGGAEPLGAGFAVQDPEPGSADASRGAEDPQYKGDVGLTRSEVEANRTGASAGTGAGFFSGYTPLLLIGGAAALYLFTRKK